METFQEKKNTNLFNFHEEPKNEDKDVRRVKY